MRATRSKARTPKLAFFCSVPLAAFYAAVDRYQRRPNMSADASVGLMGILLGEVNDTYTSYLDSSGTVV